MAWDFLTQNMYYSNFRIYIYIYLYLYWYICIFIYIYLYLYIYTHTKVHQELKMIEQFKFVEVWLSQRLAKGSEGEGCAPIMQLPQSSASAWEFKWSRPRVSSSILSDWGLLKLYLVTNSVFDFICRISNWESLGDQRAISLLFKNDIVCVTLSDRDL